MGRERGPPAHLAVKHDHVLGVGTEPRLHGFADGTELVQGRGMQLRPAEVLDLEGSGGGAWIGLSAEGTGPEPPAAQGQQPQHWGVSSSLG